MQVGIQDGGGSNWLLSGLVYHSLILGRAALPCSQSCYLKFNMLSIQEQLAHVSIGLEAYSTPKNSRASLFYFGLSPASRTKSPSLASDNNPAFAYTASLSRVSTMSRLRIVSWPILSSGLNGASSTFSMLRRSGL